MPDPGTVDAAHIPAIVGQGRASVLASVLIQITSSVAYLTALILLVRDNLLGRTALAGALLFGIGTLGFCADDFFHLLAYEMTSNSVMVTADVVEAMRLMQTDGMIVLLPLLLPFFAGSLGVDARPGPAIARLVSGVCRGARRRRHRNGDRLGGRL